ncbi:hypothetical protein CEK71_19795 [Methylovulum psychrotolerans]|uniref:Uncharacterized protein n=1 Tax=Methylovulum psychrotolerans TaxID=1704499 RepID=A0A1Z4C3J4_9GAMM|nr:hypothetical protein CEK71_19795 [Methylovulum psychrotolerans]
MAFPRAQKLAGMFAAPAFLVVEDDQPRPGLREVVAAVRSKVGLTGFAVAGFQLRHGGFGGM